MNRPSMIRRLARGTACAALLGTILSLGACGLFEVSAEETPAAVAAANPGAGEPGAALTRGERTLLQDYQALITERAKLQEDVETLRDEANRQRQALEASRGDRDREHTARVAAEAEADRLAGRTRELEAKLLAQGIEQARLEQELLELRIQVLEEELRILDDPTREAPNRASTSRDSNSSNDLGSLLQAASGSNPAAAPSGGGR